MTQLDVYFLKHAQTSLHASHLNFVSPHRGDEHIEMPPTKHKT